MNDPGCICNVVNGGLPCMSPRCIRLPSYTEAKRQALSPEGYPDSGMYAGLVHGWKREAYEDASRRALEPQTFGPVARMFLPASYSLGPAVGHSHWCEGCGTECRYPGITGSCRHPWQPCLFCGGPAWRDETCSGCGLSDLPLSGPRGRRLCPYCEELRTLVPPPRLDAPARHGGYFRWPTLAAQVSLITVAIITVDIHLLSWLFITALALVCAQGWRR